MSDLSLTDLVDVSHLIDRVSQRMLSAGSLSDAMPASLEESKTPLRIPKMHQVLEWLALLFDAHITSFHRHPGSTQVPHLLSFTTLLPAAGLLHLLSLSSLLVFAFLVHGTLDSSQALIVSGALCCAVLCCAMLCQCCVLLVHR